MMEWKVVEIKYIELICENCKRGFKIDRNYEGVVTCPYCGSLVED